MKRLLVVAGELSGDLYGGDLVARLRALDPSLDIYGACGPRMREAGMERLYDSSGWGTIGVVEALKALPRLFFAYRGLCAMLTERRPDALVLIDYPGLNMRLARRAKSLGIPVVYYFPPSKWVTDPSHVRDAARHIDYVAAPFVATAKTYRDAGANVEFVGNPLVDLVRPGASAPELRAGLGIGPGRIVALLPGSRAREIDYLLPNLLGAAVEIARRGGAEEFLMPLPGAVLATRGAAVERSLRVAREAGARVRLLVDRTYDALAVADAAVIASGTATLEAALLGCPTVVIYQVSKITEFLARRYTHLPECFALPNLILSKRAVPELIQGDVTPARIADECLPLLLDPARAGAMRSDLARVRRYLGRPGAGSRVASRILAMIY